jgi:prepilin-type processing-associated H-X9-DG protein
VRRPQRLSGACSFQRRRFREANVGFFDGHVSFLSNDLSPEVLRSLLTISGGETVALPDN